MKGLDLARQLYEETVRPALAAEFPMQEGRIAVGLAGPGSECYGFDDEISRDHDFAPRLCLWIPAEDAEEYGARLQKRYEELTAHLPGVSAQARDRSGVIPIPEFYRRFTGCPGAPEGPLYWLRVSDHHLAAATNGEVFRDDLGAFTAIRRTLLRGYPIDVMRKKLAARLFAMGQAGQYNYPRCARRGDTVAMTLALDEFLRAALQAIYLLNGRYAPFYKWLYRGAEELPRLRGTVLALKELLLQPPEERQAGIETVCADIQEELWLRGLSGSEDDFMVNQAFSVASEIRDPQLAGLDISVG